MLGHISSLIFKEREFYWSAVWKINLSSCLLHVYIKLQFQFIGLACWILETCLCFCLLTDYFVNFKGFASILFFFFFFSNRISFISSCSIWIDFFWSLGDRTFSFMFIRFPLANYFKCLTAQMYKHPLASVDFVRLHIGNRVNTCTWACFESIREWIQVIYMVCLFTTTESFTLAQKSVYVQNQASK